MLSVVELCEDGSPVDLVVVLEAADIQRLLLPDLWELVDSVPLVVPVDSEVIFEEGSMAGEAEVDSGEVTRIVVGMEVAEVVLAIREVVALVPEVEVEIATAMEGPMDTPLLLMLQLDQVAAALEAAEVAMLALALQILADLAWRQLVGMIRAEVAHMMTDPADIEAMTVMDLLVVVEVAATWSR